MMSDDRRFEAAKAAMQGYRASDNGADGWTSSERIAAWAVEDADALLAELARTEQRPQTTDDDADLRRPPCGTCDDRGAA